MIGDRAGELAAQPASVIDAGRRQRAVGGPAVGNYLVARGVVGLDEDDVAGAAEAGTMAGSGAGRPGEDRDRRQRGGGQDGRGTDTPGILHALSSTTLGFAISRFGASAVPHCPHQPDTLGGPDRKAATVAGLPGSPASRWTAMAPLTWYGAGESTTTAPAVPGARVTANSGHRCRPGHRHKSAGGR